MQPNVLLGAANCLTVSRLKDAETCTYARTYMLACIHTAIRCTFDAFGSFAEQLVLRIRTFLFLVNPCIERHAAADVQRANVTKLMT